MSRTFSPMDALLMEFDKGLRTLFAENHSARPVPGGNAPEADLSETERRHVAALMRVNHAGEVCAQALYQGQALTARNPELRVSLESAAHEETEHLAWMRQRLRELGNRPSFLNPLWYTGALALGALAGALGDKWSLGFLAETERQVEQNLSRHLDRLPPKDRRSWAMLEQMKEDEIQHADTALRLGAPELPKPVKLLMRAAAGFMKQTARHV